MPRTSIRAWPPGGTRRAGRGFYAAWRQSAGSDWAWELDEFARARHEIETLPEDPLSAIADQLRCLTVDEAQWGAYLERLALELPGWAGMFHWRAAHPGADEPPVSLTDLLAVRVVLERLHAEQIWSVASGACRCGSPNSATTLSLTRPSSR